MLMKGIIFQDGPIVYNSIEFMDNLEDAYNPVYYKDVIPGMYEVNPYGDIRDKYKNYSISKYKPDGNSYENVNVHNMNGSRSKEIVHRIVASTYCVKYNEDDDIVNHINGIKYDNFYRNLEWCDQKYNIKHAIETGLMKPGINLIHGKGEDSYNARVTNELVHLICSLLEKGFRSPEIIKQCGLESTRANIILISRIKNKISWNFISDNYNIRTAKDEESDVHLIAQALEDGKSTNEIYELLGYDVSKLSKEEKAKLCVNVSNIRTRRTYFDITSQYNF